MSDGPKHADPTFRLIRNQMNLQSNANPDTRCRRCGLYRKDHPAGDVWTTGHPDGPGDVGYAPEMRSCNSRLAAQQTNAKRHGFDVGL